MIAQAKILSVILAIVAALATALPACAFETAGREAVMVDAATGRVLFEKNADARMPPASMSKIMTLYVIFQRIKDGRLSLSDEFTVSEKAWRMGGSKMFVEVNSRVKVEDLLRGVIIQSGNDASIVLAEGVAGSEEAFAAEMNRAAEEMGLTGSHFVNATGWPHPDHYMTVRDLATLALHTINDFPEYYHLYSEKEFTWNGITQGNRNPLLYRAINVDGLKTGHTEDAGFCLTASAVEDDRRLVLVISGLNSMQQRADESDRVLSWGFREFDNYKLFTAGDTVETAPVWLGETESVPLVVNQDLLATFSHKERQEMEVKVVYEGPIAAPIANGQQAGKVVVSAPGTTPVEVPLVAGAAVPRLGPLGRIMASIKYLIFGPT
ncbi:MAG: D-alanyl-D-alanine carboxypeptidase family protein [Kiloniellales bacterium]